MGHRPLASEHMGGGYQGCVGGADYRWLAGWIRWCQPCKVLAPKLERLHKEVCGDVIPLYKLDVDAVPEVAVVRIDASKP